MADAIDTLCYHGRRSVDELVGALNADNAAAALVHRDLSLLHLDRFVSVVRTTAQDINEGQPYRTEATRR